MKSGYRSRNQGTGHRKWRTGHCGQVTGQRGTGQNTTPGQVTFSRHTPIPISFFVDSYSRFSFCGLSREIRDNDSPIPTSTRTGHFSRHITVSISFFVPPYPYFFYSWDVQTGNRPLLPSSFTTLRPSRLLLPLPPPVSSLSLPRSPPSLHSPRCPP